MEYVEARQRCHVRSAIFRTSKGVRYWKNNPVPLDERVPEEDKRATDWEEYEPRDGDYGSLFMFND